MNKVLIHRYDNEADIKAVKVNQCSDVYVRSQDNSFEYVLVIPTLTAKSNLAAYGEAISAQYEITEPKIWPGRPDGYRIRVDLDNIRFTALPRVREEIERAGVTWAAQWQVTTALLDMTKIFGRQ